MKGFLLKIKNEIKGIYSSIDDIIEFINEVVCLVDKPFKLSDIKITIYKLNTPIVQKQLVFCQNGVFEIENNIISNQYFIKSSIFKNYKSIVTNLNLKYVSNKTEFFNQSINNKKRKIEEEEVHQNYLETNKEQEKVSKQIEENKLKKEPEIDSETKQIIAENKTKMIHELNVLKKEKEKIEESKRVYKEDVKIYEKFKEELKKDSSFIISELFIEKFKIFKKLEQEGTLSWSNFMDNYKKVESSSYNSLFLTAEPFFENKHNSICLDNSSDEEINKKENTEQYNINLKIYKKIKKVLKNDVNYKIPSIFEKKYKIFQELNEENNLSYENYMEKYNKLEFIDESETSYDSDSDTDTSLAEQN